VDHKYVYPLKVGVNTLGRAGDNDVVVEDTYVSRRHCAVVVHQSGGCELHDIASRNGTHVNGTPVAGPVPLESGDEICISNRRFTFLTRTG
jgi:pSer/pThr/pTyr-binding forkhead associated (FHA) protein